MRPLLQNHELGRAIGSDRDNADIELPIMAVFDIQSSLDLLSKG